MKRSSPTLIVLSLILLGCVGCKPKNNSGGPAVSPQRGSVQAVASTTDLAADRKKFVTKLRSRGPSPQPFENRTPPAGVNEVEYLSGELKLKGWLSADAGDGKKRPAVVFLHGGFAFGDGDWEDPEPFVKAGFVLFVPMLRGENGNPGMYESFYGEVDDAIAAGQFVSALPYVDADRVYVAGHSVGAVLASLTAMMPSPFKAAAAFDGYVEMESWTAGSPAMLVPYDSSNDEEVRLRNPLACAASLRIPLRLFASPDNQQVNSELASRAKQAGRECDLVIVPGDHHSMVAPAVTQSISWFQQLAAR